MKEHGYAASGRRQKRMIIAVVCVCLVFAFGMFAVSKFESMTSAPVQNAGQQLTAYKAGVNRAEYFVDGQWIAQKDLETLLVIGLDDVGGFEVSNSYNNTSQADFMVLLVQDKKSGEFNAVHLNRDTMTRIPVLGVTGQKAGYHQGQLALAYTYGRGREDSCKNTMEAVSHLLYGIEIDHYIAVTMDSVPIANDWVGGVTVDILDDFTDVDETMVLGEKMTLKGQQALSYVRVRKGLSDSTNLHRMERQRQYADEWLKLATPLFQNPGAVIDLVVQLSDYHYSDCTAGELADFANAYANHPFESVHTLAGKNVQGEVYMEYHLDEDAVRDMVLSLFFEPVMEKGADAKVS